VATGKAPKGSAGVECFVGGTTQGRCRSPSLCEVERRRVQPSTATVKVTLLWRCHVIITGSLTDQTSDAAVLRTDCEVVEQVYSVGRVGLVGVALLLSTTAVPCAGARARDVTSGAGLWSRQLKDIYSGRHYVRAVQWK
jgi:hypothetical protein